MVRALVVLGLLALSCAAAGCSLLLDFGGDLEADAAPLDAAPSDVIPFPADAAPTDAAASVR